MKNILVTGGAGYFGEILCRKLIQENYKVRCFDLNRCPVMGVESVIGDIRQYSVIENACSGIDIVYHNVAQVPLAKNKKLFDSVNKLGISNLLKACIKNQVNKVVYTSSSAVFGIPKDTPIGPDTLPKPNEAYGEAKLEGEKICLKAKKDGIMISIIRPRTILGHGRLGIMQILFEWVEQGKPIPVFDGGQNIYQFVHAEDLAVACIAAGEAKSSGIYNIGSAKFGKMRQLLEGLILHAKSKSEIKSVPSRPIQWLMKTLGALRLSPLAPYHALMYGQKVYFDTKKAESELKFKPIYSDLEAICESYDTYIANKIKNKEKQIKKSPHLSAVKKGILIFVPSFLKLIKNKK